MKPQSIAHLFFDACDRFDKANAVMVKEGGVYKPISHKFFKQRVNHFGRGLMNLDVKKGDHIAILSETRFEWAIADLGIVTAGAVGVPVYDTLPADQIRWILDNADATGIVVSSAAQAEKILSVKAELAKLRFIIIIEEDQAPEGILTMTEVESEGAQQDNENEYIARWQGQTWDDLLTIIYTSGTTGHPKGVMLTHGNLIANVKSCEPYMPYGPQDTHLAHLPLCHVFERMSGYYSMIYRGVTIAYAENIRTVATNIREVCPTVLVSVPRLYEKIYAGILSKALASGFVKRKMFHWAQSVGQQAMPYFNENLPLPGFLAKKWAMADKLVFAKIKTATGGRLKYMTSGGAPLAQEISEFFLGMGIKLLEGYGLTETSPVLTSNRPQRNKPGTVGPPVDDVEIKISDDGEILARGPNVMKGYFKNPEATEEAIVDGWFHTGDIGLLDADQFLRITDRKKDLLVTSGGKNIAPQPLESSLKLSHLIEQAVVIGDQRNFISALVIPPWESVAVWAKNRGWPVNPLETVENADFLKAIEAEIEKQMAGFAHYEKVKAFRVLPRLLTVEEGEMTPSLKVKRRVVSERFASVIDDIYS